MSSFYRKEEIIREKRTVEATRNRYMGSGGKLCIIAKYLGDPIYAQGSQNFSQTHLEDPWLLDDPNAIPMMDEDQRSYEVGYIFSGLSRGLHLEIKYLEYYNEIEVRHKDRIVYREKTSELERYAPDSEWEEQIELLYERAMKKYNQVKRQERKEYEEKVKNTKKEIFNELRDKWGL